jgi:site-specific DNA recombinase
MTNDILHIYTRVSTSAQEDEGTSLDTQRELGKKKSEELGFAYQVWNEGGQSSSKDDLSNRPVLVSLLNEVDAGNVNHVFVFNTDRLSRNDQTWNLIRLKLVQNNVTLYTSQGVYLLSDPMNKLLLGIMSEISSYDNTIRAERSRLGKMNRVRQGFWLGGPPPFGYQLHDKKLVENPDESKWIRFIYESYRDGKTARWIKQELLRNGVRTRRNKSVWSLGSIEKVLSNTHYSGYFYYHDKKTDEKIRVQCPSILPSSLFLEVQEEKKKRTPQTRINESNLSHFYLLRDFLFCGECGSRYSGRRYAKQYRSVYYCPRRERNYVNENTEKVKKCSNRRYLKIEETDTLVWNTVVEVLSESNLFKEEIKRKILGTSETHRDTRDEIKRLKKKKTALEKEIAETTKSIVALETDRIIKKRDPVEVKQIIENVEEYRLKLESEKETVDESIRGIETQNQWIDWVAKFGDRIQQLGDFSDREKHEFLKGIIDRIVVKTADKQTHELIVSFRLPYVNDHLWWYDSGDKSKGYRIEDGTNEIAVEVDSGKKSLGLERD